MALVYLTVPTQGWMHCSVHNAILEILKDTRHSCRHECVPGRPAEEAYHKCINNFLKEGEEYWLSIDYDNPPQDNPLDLIDHDVDIVGLPTPILNRGEGDQPVLWNAFKQHEDGGFTPVEPTGDLQEVDAIGAGCILVARRVLEELWNKAPFATIWNDDGTIKMGGDLAFCQKAKEAGFKIFADFRYTCRHYKEVDLTMLHNLHSFAMASEVN
jgi:hypothetical protein